MCNEIEGLYDKIIITIAPSYTGKNITHLLPLALLLVLHTRNNTDGNKLVIFSSIALYYGDNYIITPTSGLVPLKCGYKNYQEFRYAWQQLQRHYWQQRHTHCFLASFKNIAQTKMKVQDVEITENAVSF